MRVAIPAKGKEFCLHFNNCDQFAIVEISTGTKQILDACFKTPPSLNLHILPRWFREIGIDIILVGGMDHHVKKFWSKNDIEIRVGFLESSIKGVIKKFIASQISPGNTIETK